MWLYHMYSWWYHVYILKKLVTPSFTPLTIPFPPSCQHGQKTHDGTHGGHNEAAHDHLQQPFDPIAVRWLMRGQRSGAIPDIGGATKRGQKQIQRLEMWSSCFFGRKEWEILETAAMILVEHMLIQSCQ